MLGMLLDSANVYPVVLSTMKVTTCTGNSIFMDMNDRRLYSDLSRTILTEVRSHSEVSLSNNGLWHEDVEHSPLPTYRHEMSIGLLNWSPASAMMVALERFSVEIVREGNYHNLIISPIPDYDIAYLQTLQDDSSTVDAKLIESVEESPSSTYTVNPVQPELDTSALLPATLYGSQLNEKAKINLEILDMRFPVEIVPVDKAWGADAKLVINPTVLRGTITHFDDKNRRIG